MEKIMSTAKMPHEQFQGKMENGNSRLKKKVIKRKFDGEWYLRCCRSHLAFWRSQFHFIFHKRAVVSGIGNLFSFMVYARTVFNN